MLRSRRSVWAAIAGAAAGALVVAGFATWYLVFRDVAAPTTVGDAVTSFRESTTATPGGSPVPVGVYVYATSGYEKTDALTGATHHYPSRSTVTVTKDPCGVRMRWDVLRGRSTTWTFCIGPGGWVMSTQDERHTFYGVTQATTYRCANAAFRPAGDEPGAPVSVTCRTSSATERETQWVVGRETLRVAGRPVSTVHVRQTSSLAGDTGGKSLFDFWIERRSGVPVRVAMSSHTTNSSPIGKVHYDEEVTLRLTSLRARR